MSLSKKNVLHHGFPAIRHEDFHRNKWRYFFERSFKFFLQIGNKFRYPAIVFVILLPIANEDVVFVVGDEGGHLTAVGLTRS
jgi:hypothetical protein